MTAEDLKAMLQAEFAGAQIDVMGEGANYSVKVVSDLFESKRAVQRQQMVYAVLNNVIASGEVHAVTMDLKTNAEAG
ncbi:BolA family protein [Reinekea thalattae]|uniref:BolA/IbaG family iron-sulfur metabolism protein n=1 Tax=Reinekea thalattae TaxID=2593301 RepID=A0A5C8Z265_9GAMM|nr:BolA/IbaG family iron-sulfur metabolism protein [Reinekea thalattae]TXR52175.1 BolA/IbaG family iron-sulfur metabolism protein [Reinekea thalattae]